MASISRLPKLRTFAKILENFDQFAMGEISETYDGFVFNKHAQLESKTFEMFRSSARSFVKTCSYCIKCVDLVIRDRLVLGIFDHRTQQSLLRERNLTLEKRIDICKAAENASVQSKVLRPEMVNAVQSKSVVPVKKKSSDVSNFD